MDCPACGSPVTLKVGPEQPLSTSLSDAVLAADPDERVEVTRDCWNCGWHEIRQLRVESIDTTEGNEAAVKRAALVEEITDELAAIDDIATLKEALGEIRRQRRRELPTDDTEENIPE
ncbi:hypothetical protein [Halopiger xanaduensis]|uniref:Uncharacterized protein n=1 Tax=Halopiger xanaduensis (strain DSM 18323 / JCM 14033 / SH-6) TaxID=797210 RepID=F8DDZ7_HALXS|nr:hypothetical protein [Halopiger xanaduensis]AEH39255.1 hypothetical protein Halxa_0682 [Halopiger xanaduensis SH-6]